jgi:hypothetical protein
LKSNKGFWRKEYKEKKNYTSTLIFERNKEKWVKVMEEREGESIER